MLSFVTGQSVWERLRDETKPVVLYGMGDGALKILDACHRFGITVRGIFVSDDHLRRRDFAGFPLKSLAELEAELGDFIILLCFAAFREELLSKIEGIGRRYELLAPDVPLFGGGLFDRDFLARREEDILRAESLLADEQSRKVYRAVINFKWSGRPELLRAVETPRFEIYRLLGISGQEDYCDLGGYDGDTVLEFLKETGGRYSSVTVLEPDEKNFRKLERNLSFLPPEKLRLLCAASWDKDGMLSFHSCAGRNSFLGRDGRTQVPAYSLDSLFRTERVSFVKMDVEGAERETLCGGAETLRRQAPKLLVSAYHRTEDIFSLPLLLNRMQPKYRLYLRHQPYIPAWETNLCARV